MQAARHRKGFTLIELLVVIAIIAILSASLMPALSSATDRARVTECRSNLTHVAIGLRMYMSDWGAYPTDLSALARSGEVTDDSVLLCTKTGAPYSYTRPQAGVPANGIVASCVAPATPKGERPHSYRNSFVSLQKGGKIAEVGR
jgi:prepilin-type N-terminal cleavage/methylation domain-containing protein